MALAFCLVSVVLTYGNTLGNGFVYDDRFTVLENQHIRSLRNLPEIWSSEFWAGSGRQTQNYRPLVMTSLAVDFALFEKRPWGYHLTNLCLLLFAVTMAFLLSERCLRDWHLSAGVALLFGLHPVLTESVNSISWRGDLLASGFVLATVVAYARIGDRTDRVPGSRRTSAALALCWLLFALACFAKETGITAVGVVLAYEWLLLANGDLLELGKRLRRQAGIALIGFMAISVGYLAVRTAVLDRVFHSDHKMLLNPLAFEPIVRQKLLALSVLGEYARLLAWPVHLSVDYSFRALPLELTARVGAIVGGMVVLVASLVAAVLGHRRHAALVFAVCFFWATLILVSNLIFSIQTMMAERFLALPLFGAALGVGCALKAWIAKNDPRRRRFGVAVAVVVLGILAVRTARRNQEWRDGRSLFEAAAAVAPNSAMVHFGLGSLYSDVPADPDRAAAEYEKAITILPDFAEAWSDYALTLSGLKRHEEAVAAATRAVELNAIDPLAWNNKGVAHYHAGQKEAAASAWRHALSLDAGLDEARNNLAIVARELEAVE